MRNIRKQKEPNSLTQHRCQPHSNYDNYPHKDELREKLVQEQRGICCYCMQRIYPTPDGMKIEHWQCQTLHPNRQLDYNNLLGACLGGEGSESKKQHCDTKKRDSDLSYNPANPQYDVESKIKFLGDGTIESNDTKFNEELNEVLNLNESNLVRNRKAVLDAFRDILRSKNISNNELSKELAKWDGSNGGNLKPFCQVIVYYLRKKIKRISSKTK